MTAHGEVGNTQEVYDAKHLVWTIPAFSTLSSELKHFYVCKDFTFADETMHFRIFPGGDREGAKGYVSVFPMKRLSETKSSIKCKMGLKLADGSVESVFPEYTITFQPDGRGHGHSKIFLREELLQRLQPSDVLTLVFMLSVGERVNLQSPDRKLFAQKLSEDFEDLLADKKLSDVVLVVNGVEFRVHKSVLIARSPVFAAMFEHDMAEKETGVVHITDCDEASFGTFLVYLYSGRATDITFSSALELYRTADKYRVPELGSFCTEFLGRHLSVEGVTHAVLLADQYNEGELMSRAQQFFNIHFGEIVQTKEWELLTKQDFPLSNKLIVGASSYVSMLQQQIRDKDN